MNKKWKFKNWIPPFYGKWWLYNYLFCGSYFGGDWWTANDDYTKRVESICILGFCFEKEIGEL